MRPARDWWGTPPAEPIAAWWLAGVVAAGGAYLVVASQIDGPLQVAASVALVAGAMCVARFAGLSAEDVGLGRDRVVAGVRWGAVVGAAAALAIAAAALVPGLRSFFEDDRYMGATGAEVLFETLVRIPLGTALFEELLFRGVVLGLLLRQVRPTVAVGVSSVLFGLWHVAAALGFADANAAVPDGGAGSAATVLVTVAVTGGAGAVLAWLRIRSGSVLAPAIVHAAVNSSAVLAVFFVAG
jgi:membrane protease YdiL (CAAX protease family)